MSLGDERALTRTVILVDDTTDHPLLEEVSPAPWAAPITISVDEEDADEVGAACLVTTAGTSAILESKFLISD